MEILGPGFKLVNAGTMNVRESPEQRHGKLRERGFRNAPEVGGAERVRQVETENGHQPEPYGNHKIQAEQDDEGHNPAQLARSQTRHTTAVRNPFFQYAPFQQPKNF